MRRDQTYWLLIAAAAAALVCLYVFWVRPVRAQVAREKDLLAKRESELKVLAPAAAGLPPTEAGDALRDYKKWVDAEVALKVKPFFGNLGRNLEAPIMMPDGTVADTPRWFKAAYQVRITEAANEFQRSRPDLTIPGGLFSHPPWVDGASLPDPKEFKPVTYDFNFRRALFHLVSQCRVAQVTALSIGYGKARNLEGVCRAIPVNFVATLAPDKVMDTVRTVLSAANAPGSDALATFIEYVDVRKTDTNPAARAGLTITINFEVLDFPPTPAEKPAPPAPRRPGT